MIILYHFLNENKKIHNNKKVLLYHTSYITTDFMTLDFRTFNLDSI